MGCLQRLEPELAQHTMPLDAHGKLELAQVSPPPARGEPGGAAPSPEHSQAAAIAQAFQHSGRKKVLIYLHGGLVALRTSAAESRKLLPRMEEDGYFPVFVNWDTSFFRSYGGHLIHKPNGYPGQGASFLLSPFRLVLDLLEGVASAPRAWGAAGINAWQSNSIWHRSRDPVLMQGLPLCAGAETGLSCRDPGAPTGRDQFWSTAAWRVQWPIKFLVTPLVYTDGGAAWNDMLRRTRIIFERDTEFYRERLPEASEPSGALPQLLRELEKTGDCEHPVAVTIVAHSMGTIVANAVLKRYLQNPNLVLERIVYLGAAASISDSLDALLPYLQTHVRSEFFNVMLHPLAEDRERSALGFAPDGSLLAWVDGMYQHPHSFLERTFGRWSNVKPALHLLPEDSATSDLRTRMHFHVLGFGNGPEKHGALNDTHWHFWRDAFLRGTPSSAVSEDPL